MPNLDVAQVYLDEFDKTNDRAVVSQGQFHTVRAPREWVLPFLVSLRVTGNVAQSAAVAGIDRHSVRRLREQSADFAEAMNEAVAEAVELLEAEARRRAMNGSDALLMFLLRAARPETYTQGMLSQNAAAAGSMVVKAYVGWSPDVWDEEEEGSSSADVVQTVTVANATPTGQEPKHAPHRVGGGRQEQVRGGEGARLLQEVSQRDGSDAAQGAAVDDQFDGFVL